MTRTRVAGQGGYTIVEMMITLVLTLLVMSVALSVATGAQQHSDDIQRRSDSLERGRRALDDVVRTLRSQVCLDETTTPVDSGTNTSLTVYTSFGDGTAVPEKHVISLNTATGRLTDTKYTGTAGSPPTYTSPPTVRLIGTGIVQDGTTPLFRYYGFNPATATSGATADLALATPLSDDDAQEVARIVVRLRANPEGRVTGTKNTVGLEDQVFVRLANPNDNFPTPKCA